MFRGRLKLRVMREPFRGRMMQIERKKTFRERERERGRKHTEGEETEREEENILREKKNERVKENTDIEFGTSVRLEDNTQALSFVEEEGSLGRVIGRSWRH